MSDFILQTFLSLKKIVYESLLLFFSTVDYFCYCFRLDVSFENVDGSTFRFGQRVSFSWEGVCGGG